MFVISVVNIIMLLLYISDFLLIKNELLKYRRKLILL